jgi:hypothetical protein
MPVTQVRTKQQLLVTDNVDFQNFRILNLADPTNAQDAATKAYVDAVKQALDIKDSVRVATTANITLSATQTIDGVTVAAGDRVLVKDQTTGSQNGIYVVAAGAWARSIDANISAEVTPGLFVFVEEGTANGDNGYVLTTNGPITLDTTALTFTQFSGAGQITAGTGLTKTGNTIDVIGTAGRIVANADSIDLATVSVGSTVAAGLRKFDVDSYGRISQAAAANATDINTAYGSQTANFVLAAPDAAAGNPSFRALVANDIPNHSTDKLTSGTLPIARGGTGVTGVPTNGQLLIGNGTGYTVAALTAGTAISVTNASGSITIANTGVTALTGTANQVTVSASTGSVTLSLPQNIHTSATPTFAGLTITAGTVTTSTPYRSSTQTWNAGAVSFVGELVNITDTASAAGSRFIEYQTGGVARFAVRKDGAIVTGSWAATTIAANVGGTGQTSYAVGDILFADTTSTLARLAGVATGNVLISGGVGTAPSYGKVGLTTHISGTLAVGNGGTGVTTTPTNGQLLIGNGTNYTVANLTAGTGVTITNGSGSISIAVATASILAKSDFIVREIPTGTVNGSNATFTLASTPVVGSESVYVNGILQNVGTGNDYTISGATVTFLTGAIPQTGDIVRVSYIR